MYTHYRLILLPLGAMHIRYAIHGQTEGHHLPNNSQNVYVTFRLKQVENLNRIVTFFVMTYLREKFDANPSDTTFPTVFRDYILTGSN